VFFASQSSSHAEEGLGEALVGQARIFKALNAEDQRVEQYLKVARLEGAWQTHRDNAARCPDGL
jgi:hypothetical protein